MSEADSICRKWRSTEPQCFPVTPMLDISWYGQCRSRCISVCKHAARVSRKKSSQCHYSPSLRTRNGISPARMSICYRPSYTPLDAPHCWTDDRDFSQKELDRSDQETSTEGATDVHGGDPNTINQKNVLSRHTRLTL